MPKFQVFLFTCGMRDVCACVVQTQLWFSLNLNLLHYCSGDAVEAVGPARQALVLLVARGLRVEDNDAVDLIDAAVDGSDTQRRKEY